MTITSISIHALREESDLFLRVGDLSLMEFQSTPSARRATPEQEDRQGNEKFQSTPSARRATGMVGTYTSDEDGFQSTPSARRATLLPCAAWPTQEISIHALREESDICGFWTRSSALDFNPRPPRGERPCSV